VQRDVVKSVVGEDDGETFHSIADAFVNLFLDKKVVFPFGVRARVPTIESLYVVFHCRKLLCDPGPKSGCVQPLHAVVLNADSQKEMHEAVCGCNCRSARTE
jgi:hypothetical protein